MDKWSFNNDKKKMHKKYKHIYIVFLIKAND